MYRFRRSFIEIEEEPATTTNMRSSTLADGGHEQDEDGAAVDENETANKYNAAAEPGPAGAEIGETMYSVLQIPLSPECIHRRHQR